MLCLIYMDDIEYIQKMMIHTNITCKFIQTHPSKDAKFMQNVYFFKPRLHVKYSKTENITHP